MSKTYVLDASAMLALLDSRPGARRISQLIEEADRTNTPLLASVVNWGEVLYVSWQRHGAQSAHDTLDDLSHLPIHLLPVDQPQALKAAELRALHHLPYVDCLAAALAAQQHSILVTADRDFEKLGRNFPILWIAR